MAGDNVVYRSVPDNDKNGGKPIPNPPKGLGVRHIQALILFLSLSIGYTMRSQLSVSIVAMTKAEGFTRNVTCYDTHWNLTITHENAENFNFTEFNHTICHENEELDYWDVYRTYKWKKSVQEMILFSFFVGYTSMMLPMGLTAQRFGGKIPILIALGANSVLSFVTPWAPIFGGWLAVCACRFLQGMTQAALYPSIHTILGKWAPISERGRLSTYIYTGSQCGTILAFPIAGLFAGHPSLGWPATFWLFGVLSLVCFCLVFWLGASTPHEHPSISAEELAFITGDGVADVVPKKRRTPWKHILTCKAVWGMVASHSGCGVGYLFLLTQIPLYMDKVLGVNIKQNGLLSALPYISMALMVLTFGQLSDFISNRKYMSIVNIRRTANTIGMVVASLFMVGFSFVSSPLSGIILLILTLGLHSGIHVGFHINQIDLAPNFAGPIMAFSNMFGSLSVLLVPVLVSTIIKDDVGNQSKWQILFIIVAAIKIVANIIFVIFAKGEVQPWNFYGDEDEGF